MRVFVVTSVLLVLSVITIAVSQPLVKVECAGLPLFRGRVDSIVNPGIVGNHVHRVFGASNFGAESPNNTPLQIFNTLRASPCNTCSLKFVDNSAYWHPELYYRWPNSSLSMVPRGGLTVYYEGRTGTGNQANPKYAAFPPGFRMIAGNPFRRSFDPKIIADTAVSFACLSAQGGPETNKFPDYNTRCINGLRMQVYFPSCWNGKDVDVPDHQSHVTYPLDRYDNGNCPDTHPVRLLSVFFEAFYSVDQFPQQNYQPFVLSCGDATGYGFHGDFMNGWDQDLLQQAINSPTCDAKNTNNGNTVKNCAPLSQYVVDPSNGACDITPHIPLTEALGMVYAIPRLPGCQNITGEQNNMPAPCMAPPSASYSPPISMRFLLKSKSTNMYVTAPVDNSKPLVANKVSSNPSLTEVFAPLAWSGGGATGINIVPEAGYGINYCSAHGTNGALVCDRPSASNDKGSWEAFSIEPQSGGWIAIKSFSNNNYVTVQGDGSLAPTSSSVGDAQLFMQSTPNGGGV